jgi:hypothetical protein
MISCHIKHLEMRCLQRGYTIDEVKNCIVSRDGDKIVVDETHQDYPRHPKPGFDSSNVEFHSSIPSGMDLTRKDSPSFITKIKNFVSSSVEHVASGMKMASDEEIIRRHDICMVCEFMKNNSCTKCGCPLVREKKYVSKLSWADSKCPVGKWGPSLNE